jgi:hypothetical protein
VYVTLCGRGRSISLRALISPRQQIVHFVTAGTAANFAFSHGPKVGSNEQA